ncbi:hypothetical protein [Couchioplanes caeruleus]|uniref:Uncharacterized protein n=2 Tax=Couchioplanes caeruleus TaxID=56438 RepID=A0A1K0GAH7_9ACTN|nr:hypothetical protein [Couchioplanes caeruleus]OJF14250.1 hypothetical protein BG844_10720 [Couchioplanes caeruleus subsp. caeruleus]ROP30340.1 hypothetical protein EDD30_3183 [Couchioplanes caeruleus]
MPDQFDTLFADMRAETLPQVRPPGPAAARDTVRRRRTTRTVVAASAVLAVAGTLTAVGLSTQRETPAERLDRLTAAAQKSVGDKGSAEGFAVIGSASPESTERFPDLSPGRYTVAVGCGGSGTLTMSVTLTAAAGSTDLGGQVASCAAEPTAARMEVQLPVDGELTVALHADQAAGDAVYVMMVARNEEADQAVPVDPESTWNADRAAQVLSSGGGRPVRMTTERPGRPTTQRVGAAGEYRLRMVCAGPGNITVTMAGPVENPLRPHEATLLSRTVACTDVDPEPVIVGVGLEKNTEVTVTVTADGQAHNKAGFAYVLAPA